MADSRPKWVDGIRDGVRERMQADGREPTEAELDDGVAYVLQIPESRPHPVETFDVSELSGIPVIVGDEVAYFCHEVYGQGGSISDAVATMAPPFDSFFIEFQGAPNSLDAYAWGVFVTTSSPPAPHPDDTDAPRWVLQLRVFAEKRKGKPAGPLCVYYLGLDDDGTWFRYGNGDSYWKGGPPFFEPPIPEHVEKEWGDSLVPDVFPALMTISFMHASNVSIEAVDPPEKLSKKFEKRTGRPLSRYHVLEIDPMRKQLESTGATRGQLRQSLHLARGHFKVFTEDAPLFGRHVGTYWWGQQVRGSRERGVVAKDYRVARPGALGRPYEEVSEAAGSPKASPGADPDAYGRGLSAHMRTQNLVSQTVRALGLDPRKPNKGSEPECDIAWLDGETTWVCEVKSLTATNERDQLYRALGQVIKYRAKLNAQGRDVQAAIVVEKQPRDETWEDPTCKEEGIVLAWPEVLEERLAATEEPMRSTDADE